MKYRIVNIDYWRQFANRDSLAILKEIQGWMNDEVHEMDDIIADHGLINNCITRVDDSEESLESMKEEKEEPVAKKVAKKATKKTTKTKK